MAIANALQLEAARASQSLWTVFGQFRNSYSA